MTFSFNLSSVRLGLSNDTLLFDSSVALPNSTVSSCYSLNDTIVQMITWNHSWRYTENTSQPQPLGIQMFLYYSSHNGMSLEQIGFQHYELNLTFETNLIWSHDSGYRCSSLNLAAAEGYELELSQISIGSNPSVASPFTTCDNGPSQSSSSIAIVAASAVALTLSIILGLLFVLRKKGYRIRLRKSAPWLDVYRASVSYKIFDEEEDDSEESELLGPVERHERGTCALLQRLSQEKRQAASLFSDIQVFGWCCLQHPSCSTIRMH
jgi:hypothetical protein